MRIYLMRVLEYTYLMRVLEYTYLMRVLEYAYLMRVLGYTYLMHVREKGEIKRQESCGYLFAVSIVLPTNR